MPLDYPEIEGRLASLGRDPEARPSRAANPSTLPLQRREPGPRALSRESESRVDLTFAVRRLPAEEQTVLREHYIDRSRRHPYPVRNRAIKHLRLLLSTLDEA